LANFCRFFQNFHKNLAAFWPSSTEKAPFLLLRARPARRLSLATKSLVGCKQRGKKRGLPKEPKERQKWLEKSEKKSTTRRPIHHKEEKKEALEAEKTCFSFGSNLGKILSHFHVTLLRNWPSRKAGEIHPISAYKEPHFPLKLGLFSVQVSSRARENF